jgi:protoglobin
MTMDASYLPATDMPRFVREMMEFVDLTDADLHAIRRTAPVVLRHGDALTAAVYEHFLAFPRSARFFLRDDGGVDTARLERRKHSLARWLRESAQAALGHEFSYYLLSVGIAHSHRAQGPGGPVPPHLMIGTMSVVQTALARIFADECGAGEAMAAGDAMAATVAWNKLLLVHLSVMLLSYVPPRLLP